MKREEILETHHKLPVHVNSQVTEKSSIYRQTSIWCLPHLAPMKVCEQESPIKYTLFQFPATLDITSAHVANTEWYYTGV
jgi:hypothetical protein